MKVSIAIKMWLSVLRLPAFTDFRLRLLIRIYADN